MQVRHAPLAARLRVHSQCFQLLPCTYCTYVHRHHHESVVLTGSLDSYGHNVANWRYHVVDAKESELTAYIGGRRGGLLGFPFLRLGGDVIARLKLIIVLQNRSISTCISKSLASGLSPPWTMDLKTVLFLCPSVFVSIFKPHKSF